MKKRSKCYAIVSLLFAVVASAVTWLVLNENSPFDTYFLYHVTGRNFVGRLVFVPYVVVLLLRPSFGADELSYILIFFQWLLVGIVLAILICRARKA
jgi:hypothetical protein